MNEDKLETYQENKNDVIRPRMSPTSPTMPHLQSLIPSFLPKRHFSCLLVFLFFHAFWTDVCWAARKSHYVHWNTSNPIFRIDNTDHIIDVNRGNQPWEYDQVNIICPLYRPEEAQQAEKYIIYSVSKDEYDSCRIMSTRPRIIAQCTEPHELMYFTITFRSFTPTPGGMEFQPGKDYYFISTSSASDVHRRVGGRCATHNMKIQFKVANNHHESLLPQQSRPRAVNVPRLRRPLPEPAATTVGSTTTTTTSRSTHSPNYLGKLPRYYGDLSYYPYGTDGGDYKNDQRVSEYHVHTNEVIKHEASRMASAARTSLHSTEQLLLLLMLLLFSSYSSAMQQLQW